MTDLLGLVNRYWPGTLRRVGYDPLAVPGRVPFLGAFVELCDGAALPPEADVLAKRGEYDAAVKRDGLLAALAARRYAAEVGGVSLGGFTSRRTKESRANLIAARIKAKEDPDYALRWKTPAGFVTLDAAAIIAAADAALAFVQRCFDAEAALTEDADDYDTPEQIASAFDTLTHA